MNSWPWRKHWWGYTNLGTIQIPPPPKYTILTDRGDGVSLWLLTFNISEYPEPDGLGLIGINVTPVPPWPSGGNPGNPNLDPMFPAGKWPYGPYYGNVVIWKAYEEPWLRTPRGVTPYLANSLVRLVIVSGQLGVDVEPITSATVAISQERVICLQSAYPGYNVAWREIILTAASPGVGWQDYTVTQTPNPGPYVPSFSQQNDD